MKIGELAQQTGTETVTIRFYEKRGLMPPPKRTDNNYRVYADAHRERLLFIRHRRGMGINLDEIGELLKYRDQPEASCQKVNGLIDSHVAQVHKQIKELQGLEKQLQQLRHRCNQSVNPEGQTANCGILQTLERCQPKGACKGH